MKNQRGEEGAPAGAGAPSWYDPIRAGCDQVLFPQVQTHLWAAASSWTARPWPAV